MKTFFSILICFTFGTISAQTPDIEAVNQTLDSWHKAAAEAKFDVYFSLMASDAVFIGTDATENWSLKDFKAFSKPFFDKGKAWSFKSIQRNVYFNQAKDLAWFDELLDTQMKICRGSGILRKENGQWKIAHYVLSMTIPNDFTDAVIKIKAPTEEAYIKSLQKK
jgi:ketosteroid isomerase-like protein